MGSDDLEDLYVDGRIILKRILRKRVRMVRTEFIRLGIGYNNGNDSSSSVNFRVFYGSLSNC